MIIYLFIVSVDTKDKEKYGSKTWEFIIKQFGLGFVIKNNRCYQPDDRERSIIKRRYFNAFF